MDEPAKPRMTDPEQEPLLTTLPADQINPQTLTDALYKAMADSGKPYDLAMIDEALAAATYAHNGQKRSSGEEYICHPIQVATTLVGLGMDSATVEAALLHDVVEDTPITIDRVRKDFGDEVARLVDGVTKLDMLSFSTKEEQQAENIRKMLLAMSEDIRVVIIKLADRLHNMSTINALPEQKRRDKAKETMDVYAPLAHRLGIRGIMEQLEDFSLHILDPVAYQEIEQALDFQKEERQAFLESIKQRICDHLAEYGLHPYVSGRIKSITGIYRKMYMQNHALEEIYDIYAVRVIVDTVNDCYNVLGIVHEMFRPLPNRFKDYISTPKPNMYQSLHTTVLGKEKIPFEVQIRTWEMHRMAEYGIAAHWKYKLGILKDDKLEQRLAWVRQFIENQRDADDAQDIISTIKTDLASDDVFVFTPKGDVISLPVGSTVIDFAYAIHSAVGNRMVGAKVDGRIVPLDTVVKTGQIVEVLTTSAQGHGPSRDWLNIVKTGEAKSKIRNWFKKERREENIEQGRSDFERELTRNNIRLPEDKMRELIEEQVRRQHCVSEDDFFASIGYGGLVMSRLMPRIKDDYTRMVRENEELDPETLIAPPKHGHNGGVIVEGMDNCLVRFARCCNPLPGDNIIGFITRGFGVSVHKCDCVNVPKDFSKSSEPERWVTTVWESTVREEFKASLQISARDRERLLADITAQLASMHVTIYAVNAREAKSDGQAVITLTIGVNSLEHLQSVIGRLEHIPNIEHILRTGI